MTLSMIPWQVFPVVLLLGIPGDQGTLVRSSIGDLHGFPSMSDESGHVIALGELRQERRRDRLIVHARWAFRDGHEAEETDEFEVAEHLAQVRFSWIERRRGDEQRRFEVNFDTGSALALTRADDKMRREDARLDLPRGRAFAGYGTALAVSQMPLDAVGAAAEVTFIAFTPKPRTVTLEVRRDAEEQVRAAGRSIPCYRVTLHPKIPFPISVFVHAEDAHLWFTRTPPTSLIRAEESLVAKDDPRVVVDVIPRVDQREPPQSRRPGP